VRYLAVDTRSITPTPISCDFRSSREQDEMLYKYDIQAAKTFASG
jgi:hypothetical protein